MTILNTGLLLGLAFIVLPLLIHLLGRRRLKIQEFSSLEFLKKLQKRRMKKLRVRQILLLILRTLGILFLALAFLRPILKSTNFSGSGKVQSVILLDLSASMNVVGGEISAIERIRSILGAVKNSSEQSSIVVMNENNSQDIGDFNGNKQVDKRIALYEIDGRKESQIKSFIRAEKLLNESSIANKEILWISDFNGSPEDSLEKYLPENVNIWRVPVKSPEKKVNYYVKSANFRDVVLRQGETINLEVSFVSWVFGENVQFNDAGVSVNIKGKRVADGVLHFEKKNIDNKVFSFRCPEPGTYEGEIEIETDDALAIDNRYPFVLKVPDKKRVLICGYDIISMKHIKLALDPKQKGNIADISIRNGGIEGVKLENYDVLIIADPANVSFQSSKRLKQYVESGNGLWIMPGNQTDISSINRNLFPQLGFGSLTTAGTGVHSATWSDLDLSHPVFTDLIKRGGEIDKPLIKRPFVLSESEKDKVLIRYGIGQACLIERDLGKGKVWFSTFNADSSWGDWSYSGLFAPMVQQSALYLGDGASQNGRQYYCGDEINWDIKEELISRNGLEVIDPLGNTLPAKPYYSGDKAVLKTETTIWPGHYTLRLRDEDLKTISVSISPEESEIGSSSDEKRWPGKEIRLKEGESLSDTLKKVRFGKEISILFLVLALLAFVAENIIAREKRN